MTVFSSEAMILRLLIAHLEAKGLLDEEEFAGLLERAPEIFGEGRKIRADLLDFADVLRGKKSPEFSVIQGGRQDDDDPTDA